MVTETITWIDPDANETTFVDLRGITGRGLPPVVFSDMVVPGQPGAVFRQVRDDARQVVLPVLLQETDPVSYREALRALARTLHPTTVPGRLRVETIDGLTRDLNCWYVDGFGLLEEYPDWSTPSLLFRATDPYWYDLDAQTETWALAAADAFFPIFPLSLAPSTIDENPATVTVAGDVAVWPVWTITGPFTTVRLTLGDRMTELVYPAATGEVVVIDTAAKTVMSGATNLYAYLTSRQVFQLQPGANDVEVVVLGARAATEIELSYRDGWLSA